MNAQFMSRKFRQHCRCLKKMVVKKLSWDFAVRNYCALIFDNMRMMNKICATPQFLCSFFVCCCYCFRLLSAPTSRHSSQFKMIDNVDQKKSEHFITVFESELAIFSPPVSQLPYRCSHCPPLHPIINLMALSVTCEYSAICSILHFMTSTKGLLSISATKRAFSSNLFSIILTHTPTYMLNMACLSRVN